MAQITRVFVHLMKPAQTNERAYKKQKVGLRGEPITFQRLGNTLMGLEFKAEVSDTIHLTQHKNRDDNSDL